MPKTKKPTAEDILRKNPETLTDEERGILMDYLWERQASTGSSGAPTTIGGAMGRALGSAAERTVMGMGAPEGGGPVADALQVGATPLAPISLQPKSQLQTAGEIAASLIPAGASGRLASGVLRNASPLKRLIGNRMARMAGAAAGGGAFAGAMGEDPLEGAAVSAGGELFGTAMEPLVNPASRLLARGAVKLMPKAAPGARQALLDFADAGENWKSLGFYFDIPKERTLSLGQVTQSPGLQRLENVIATAFGAGGTLRGAQGNAAARAGRAYNEVADRIIKDFDPVEAGEIIQGMIENKSAAFRSAAAAMYQKVDDLVGHASVDIRPVKDWAAKELAKKGPKDDSLLRILRDLVNEDDYLTFADASRYRSAYISMGDSANTVIKGQLQGTSKQLAKQFDDQMGMAAKNVGAVSGIGHLGYRAYREASAFYKNGARLFNDRSITALMQKDPELVVRSIVPLNGRVNVSLLRRIKKIAGGDRKTQEAIRGTVLTQLVQRASKPESLVGEFFEPDSTETYIIAKNLLSELKNMKRSGAEEVFGKSNAHELMRVTNMMFMAQKKNPAPGGINLGLWQFGAGLGLTWYGYSEFGGGTGPNPYVTAGVLLGPRAVARIFTDPAWVRLMARSSTVLPGTAAGRQVSGQILARINDLRRSLGDEEVRHIDPSLLEEQ